MHRSEGDCGLSARSQLQPPQVVVLTVVAINKDDEKSKCALQWARDNLFRRDDANKLILVHVKNKPPTEVDHKKYEAELEQLFRSYRIYCARKGVQIKEVVLEDCDVSRALLAYVKTNHISNLVVGSTKTSSLSKWMKIDVPTTVFKHAPEFCSVYVVSKTKLLAVKQALRPAANTAAPPKMPSPIALPLLMTLDQLESDNSKGQYVNPGHRSTGSDGLPSDRNLEITGPARRFRSAPMSMENIEIEFSERSSCSRDSFSDDYDTSGVSCFGSFDTDGLDFYGPSSDIPSRVSGTGSNIGTPPRDVEAEMRRLKLELKQTMEMYNNACKEAIYAKKQAKELQEWKMEEMNKLEEAKHAEEKTRKIIEKEKQKCKAAIEAANKLAEIEAKRRREAELKLQKEAEAYNLLSDHAGRYRKYHIEEIAAATENFSNARKVGEGGYGPVYKGYLDHTSVAIKILRPDAAQGRKQFQQEIEVLSCIRHPNMVLLIGACPEHGCLVYEYMNNGNLEDRLLRRGSRSPLSWKKRFRIAAEIATALAFLHQSKPEPIVHRDLKPANILLDRNYVSKISDVGLARLVPASTADAVTQCHITSAAGTFCYIDPEYQQSGMLTTKSDIYSLGVLLLQIITARPPMALINLVQTAIEDNKLEEILDSSVTDWPAEEALAFAKLALKCTELRKKDRPDLSQDIVPELNRLRHIKKSNGSNKTPPQSPLMSPQMSPRNSISCSTTDFSQASTVMSYNHPGSDCGSSPREDSL
uniref:RING-type E3 ubiquitin transferase n=1 Tax=Kalanchoe fedtschenkoi TaxID=63787 RepID=A0A7N0VCN1_KALFE